MVSLGFRYGLLGNSPVCQPSLRRRPRVRRTWQYGLDIGGLAVIQKKSRYSAPAYFEQQAAPLPDMSGLR